MTQGPGGFIAALLLLAAGFGGGYLLGSGGTPRGAPHAATAPQAGGGAASPQPELLTAANGPELESAGNPSGLRAVLARLPAPEVPRGEGVITGRVMTQADAPIPGAVVRATPPTPESMRSWTPRSAEPLPLDELVRRTVAAHRWRKLAAATATTDADGTFRLEGLADTEYEMLVTHPDYALQRGPDGPRRARPGADLHYTMEAQVRVRADLVLPDGSTPERGTVLFQGHGHTRHAGWQASDPVVRVPPGTYTVSATAGEGGTYKSEAQRVTLGIGTHSSLHFELRGRPGIVGRLVYPPGERWRRGRVAIAWLAPGVRADAALLDTDDHRAYTRPGPRAGRYEFKDLRPGRYLLGATRTYNGPFVVMEEVEVGDGPVERDLHLPPLEREQYVEVRVLDPDGEPLTEVSVTAGCEWKSGGSSGGSDPLVRPDGSLWVLHHASGIGMGEGGHYWVEIHSELYGTRRVVYDRASQRTLTVRYAPPATLSVDIKGIEGTRYEGRVGVLVVEDDGNEARARSGSATRWAAADPTGRAVLADLQPGRYRVEARVGDRRWGFPVASTTAVLTSAANRLQLAVPSLSVVTFEGVEGRVWVSRTDETGGGHRSAQAAADGRVVMDGLPSGSYMAVSGSKRKEFTLPGASTVDLR